MKSNLSVSLAEHDELTTYHYKVILYLDGIGEATQTKMSEQLGTTKQRINKICKQLESMDIIQVKRKEGRNIFSFIYPPFLIPYSICSYRKHPTGSSDFRFTADLTGSELAYAVKV